MNLQRKKMVKLKDIATIQTGVYLKSTPSPDTCYLQVNDFDEEGNIRPTVRPTTTVSSKAARHLLTESDLLLAAKGGKNFCAIAPDATRAVRGLTLVSDYPNRRPDPHPIRIPLRIPQPAIHPAAADGAGPRVGHHLAQQG